MGDDELAEFGEYEFLRLIGVNERGDGEPESVVIGLTDRSPVF